LLELVGTLAVLLTLAALILPAIGNSREAARRTQCRSNLGQIALALHNYHAAHGVLPPGCVNETGPVKSGTPTDNHFGWAVQILPQIDEANSWRMFDFHRTSYQQTFGALTLPAVLQCPNAPTGGHSYAGCHHDVPAPIDVADNGVLFLNSSIRLRDISDGLAYTLLVGEIHAGMVAGAWYQGTEATLRSAGDAPDADEAGAWSLRAYQEFYAREESAGGASNAGSGLAPTWFGSLHTGGSNFALADGSVRALSARISPDVLRRLGNRHDGKVIREAELQ
jgi:prepilin-type processing-associated H-X9-DG protein